MGKLTKEKEEQILKTYRKSKSYAGTAEIEDVDPRTVAKLVKKQHLAEEADASCASAQGTAAAKKQNDGGSSNTPAQSNGSSEATKISPAAAANTAAAESTAPEDDRGLSSQLSEAKVVELYRNNGTPLDAVEIYGISMDLAESLYEKFLRLQFYEQFPEMRQKMHGEKAARDYLTLAVHMTQEGLNPATYVGDLKRFTAWRSVADQLPALKAELRDLQECIEDKESKLEAVTEELAQADCQLDAVKKNKTVQKQQIEQRQIEFKQLEDKWCRMHLDILELRDRALIPSMRQAANQIFQDKARIVWEVVNVAVAAILTDRDLVTLIISEDLRKSNPAYQPLRPDSPILQRAAQKVGIVLQIAYDRCARDLLRQCSHGRLQLDIY